jgi:hypothetical protein
MSVYNCAFRGRMPLGNLLSGWLVPMFTAPVVLAVNGLALILMALYFLLVQRRWPRFDVGTTSLPPTRMDFSGTSMRPVGKSFPCEHAFSVALSFCVPMRNP